MKERIIKIGTRKSRLAILQAGLVCAKIAEHFPAIKTELIKMSTRGDECLDIKLDKIGGKGLFTKELEIAIQDGRIDMAVHSAKDMPLHVPEGLCISPVLKREDPSDWIISKEGISIFHMKKGSLIATGSLRREMQLKELNPDIKPKSIRGNVLTRLKKLKEEEYDALVLAAAGVKRLMAGMGEEVLQGFYIEKMNPELFLPAAAQGILAVETRKGEFCDILEALGDKETIIAYETERKFLSAIGADCNAPYGVYCREGEDASLILSCGYGTGRMRKKTIRIFPEEADITVKELAGELKRADGYTYKDT